MTASGLIGGRANAVLARQIAHGATMGLLVFVALAFGTLLYAFVTSDFSLQLVASNSHTLKPLIYVVAGDYNAITLVIIEPRYNGVSPMTRPGAQMRFPKCP